MRDCTTSDPSQSRMGMNNAKIACLLLVKRALKKAFRGAMPPKGSVNTVKTAPALLEVQTPPVATMGDEQREDQLRQALDQYVMAVQRVCRRDFFCFRKSERMALENIRTKLGPLRRQRDKDKAMRWIQERSRAQEMRSNPHASDALLEPDIA
jgi:hypothetical protein